MLVQFRSSVGFATTSNSAAVAAAVAVAVAFGIGFAVVESRLQTLLFDRSCHYVRRLRRLLVPGSRKVIRMSRLRR